MKRSEGFTLIEVLVALLILAVTSVVLYQSWNGSFLAVRKGKNYNIVGLLLQRKVTEFEVQSKNKKIDELKEEDKGDFGSDYPDYSWEIKLKPFTVPQVGGPKNSEGAESQVTAIIFKTISEYFEKAVREVLVTVNYKFGSKTLHYNISTIYVDYSQQLPTGF
jgi:prepilin-type N-terminal cleavage/methylation domain-containing protein